MVVTAVFDAATPSRPTFALAVAPGKLNNVFSMFFNEKSSVILLAFKLFCAVSIAKYPPCMVSVAAFTTARIVTKPTNPVTSPPIASPAGPKLSRAVIISRTTPTPLRSRSTNPPTTALLLRASSTPRISLPSIFNLLATSSATKP